jgi:indole-3-glycerol phosphate synthase
MNILDEIVAFKKKEVAARKERYPMKSLEKSASFERRAFSLCEFISMPEKSGIIAEIKRKSPSKGIINAGVSVERTSVGYVKAGASALSILTDSNFFGGSSDDLITARKLNACPILRKDFTVDEYQIIEAKSIGADAILLIAAALPPNVLRSYASLAHSLGLEVLVEVHNDTELKENIDSGADLMGVNNRNLKTFELDVAISKTLASLIPMQMIKVSESGIESVDTVMELRQHGFTGFLMGQNFMQHEKPEVACREFIDALQKRSTSRE